MVWNPLRKYIDQQVAKELRQSLEKGNLFGMISVNNLSSPQFPTFTIDKAVKEGLKQSPWVYRCVNVIADAFVSVPLQVVDDKGEPVDNHPLNALLKVPNPEMQPNSVKKLMIQHLQLAGSCYLKKVKVGKKTVELWPLFPDKIAPVPSTRPGKLLESYQYNSYAGLENFLPEDVIHIKYDDPENPLKGISPLEAASKEVDIAVSQAKWNKSSFDNRGNPDGILSFEGDLSVDQCNEIEQSIRDKRTGTDNAHKIWVMNGGAKFTEMSQNSKEMDFIKSAMLVRETICAVFGVPPQLVGIMDSSTFNNLDVTERIFWQQTMVSILLMICDALTWGFRDELDGYLIKPDLNSIKALEESLDNRVKVGKDLFGMGVPVSEINDRLKLGLDTSRISTADESFLQNVTAAEQVLNPPTPPQFGSDNGDEVPPAQDENTPPEKQEKSLGTLLTRMIEALKEIPDDNSGIQMEADPISHHWRSIDNTKKSLETKYQKKCAETFRTERYHVLSAFAEGSKTKALNALARGSQAWHKTLSDMMTETIHTVSKMPLKPGGKAGRSIRAKSARTSAYVDKYVAGKVQSITDTTRERLKNVIDSGLDEEKTIQEIRSDIEDMYDGFESSRASMIASTEVGGASGYAQLESGNDAGMTKKVWVSSRDDHVRDSHQIDGEDVDMDEPFSCGVQFPCDPDADDASEVINCRCALTFESASGEDLEQPDVLPDEGEE